MDSIIIRRLLCHGVYKQSCIRVIIDSRMVMDVNMFMACCGLDCEKCEARLATINNDDKLKKKVAEEWSKLGARGRGHQERRAEGAGALQRG